MSCYAHKEDPTQFVDIFNRTVSRVYGECRLSTHLCFGNFRARSVAPRSYAPLFPAFYNLNVNEIHLEMASREFSQIEMIAGLAEYTDVPAGIVDVKSYYIEAPEEIAARAKLKSLVDGVNIVRRERGLL